MEDEIDIFEKHTKNFSNRIRNLRNLKKISAREMSLSLGQNVNYINLIENGKRYPSLQGFFAICNYLEISPEDFFSVFNDEDDKKNQNSKINLEKRIISISNTQAQAIINLLDSFI